MLHVTCPFWQPNSKSLKFSRCYDESWVVKLYNGFRRNLTCDFKFVCFTDRIREYPEGIEQELIESRPINYGACIEPYKLNAPMILVGLDTVIIGNIDHLAYYCLHSDKIVLPRDPFTPDVVCNGVALVPAGHRGVWVDWNGENDMQWMRQQSDVNHMDDLWPGHVVSYKGHVLKHGLGDARIVYFHGKPKMHEIDDKDILSHWT